MATRKQPARAARPMAKGPEAKQRAARTRAAAAAETRPSRWAQEMAAQLAASRAAKGPMAKAFKQLCARAGALPGAWEDHPWGHTAYKVGKKMFVVFGCSTAELTCTTKLPESGEAALTLFGFASPTGHGMGKSGWVTASFRRGDEVPLPVLAEWIGESYAAVAPKRRAAAGPPSLPRPLQRAIRRR